MSCVTSKQVRQLRLVLPQGPVWMGTCGWGEVTSATDRGCRFLVPGKPGRWLRGKHGQIMG